MNKCYIINILSDFRTALSTLSALPRLDVTLSDLEVTLDDKKRVDALIKIRSRSGSSEYLVQAKRGVTTTTLPAVLATIERAQRQVKEPPLLLSDYLTPAVTEKLLTEHIEFVDGAGNVFLDSSAAYVLVLNKKPERKPKIGGFTATDLELIFALLSAPRLRRATYRDLSAATGVSLGKISATLNQLEAVGYLIRSRSGTLLLQNPAQLLERWEYGYLEQLRPRLTPTRLRLGKGVALTEVMAQARALPDILIGGECAADKLTRYLKPGTLTLHVPKGKTKAVTVDLRLPPGDGEADVILLERFVPQPPADTKPLDQYEAKGTRLAHPILVRAELLALNDARLRDVADRLLEETILPELNQDA